MSQKNKKRAPKAESFADIQKKWYAKLKKSGFEDAERPEGDRFALKNPSEACKRDIVIKDYYAKLEYYSMARKFIHDYKFESNLEKVIWEYHSEGVSVRNIAKLLKKVKVMKPNKDNVALIVARLADEMKKMYLVGYLN